MEIETDLSMLIVLNLITVEGVSLINAELFILGCQLFPNVVTEHVSW